MKKILFFLALTFGSFSMTSATLPVHTEPTKGDSKKATTEAAAAAKSDDLSEYCKPDWSGHDTLSPDISTRKFVYPKLKKAKKTKKKIKRAIK